MMQRSVELQKQDFHAAFSKVAVAGISMPRSKASARFETAGSAFADYRPEKVGLHG
jgi:hypothetical protein